MSRFRAHVLAAVALHVEAVNAVVEELHSDFWPAWVWDVLENAHVRSEYDAAGEDDDGGFA